MMLLSKLPHTRPFASSYVMVMKPMTDLCWVCRQNSMAIMRSANTPEAEKSQVKKQQLFDIQSYTDTSGAKRC